MIPHPKECALHILSSAHSFQCEMWSTGVLKQIQNEMYTNLQSKNVMEYETLQRRQK